MTIESDDDGSGYGIRGNSKTAIGVLGISDSATGVAGGSSTGDGIRAVSLTGRGLFAVSGGDAIVGQSDKHRGIVGIAGDQTGVSGESRADNGVIGQTKSGTAAGVFGLNNAAENGNGITGLAKGLGGIGVFGSAELRGVGVSGSGATGIVAVGTSGPGIIARSEQEDGVLGWAMRNGFAGVKGNHGEGGTGVHGNSPRGIGVEGEGTYGVWGATSSDNSTGCGIVGTRGIHPSSGWTPSAAAICCAFEGEYGHALMGESNSTFFPAIEGQITNPLSLAPGVLGVGPTFGVFGRISCTTPNVLSSAVYGEAKYDGHVAVKGMAEWSATGVYGRSEGGIGVCGWSSGSGTGVYGFSPNSTNVNGYAFAGNFHGAVNVTGPVHKSGGGFLIDHPEDPAGKYLPIRLWNRMSARISMMVSSCS
jgi:hypothetical protein